MTDTPTPDPCGPIDVREEFGPYVAGDGRTGTLIERLGIEFTEASADLVRGTMPVEGNVQPYGILHGGASAALAETLGSTGAAMHAGRDRIAVGVELSCTHHRAVDSGTVTATARALHRGNTVATYEIVVEDEKGRRVCTARLTCVLRDRPPLS